jgi:hypothetical protein
MVDTSNTTAKATAAAQSAPDVKTSETVEKLYFVPEYGVSVSATSLSDAVAKAKKAKGIK